MASSKTTARKDVGTVGEAIRQSKPFQSDTQEALLTLLMATDKIHRPYDELFAEHDLTRQQFNVLRILRGAGKNGLPTLDIAGRMVERTPGITRLIDRLEKKGWVERVRSPEDRRQVWCLISKDGLTLLRRVDKSIEALNDDALSPLNPGEVRQLIRLLDRIRTSD